VMLSEKRSGLMAGTYSDLPARGAWVGRARWRSTTAHFVRCER
jgi:hypothetical protein